MPTNISRSRHTIIADVQRLPLSKDKLHQYVILAKGILEPIESTDNASHHQDKDGPQTPISLQLRYVIDNEIIPETVHLSLYMAD